ncbi:homoserine kinase [Bartonella sp. TP]|uniref:homoserine kinase n=1 Tax=Bartonella sp. TP TaxID=3057550 RepID=UPI0025AF2A6F|nr:homoserine kinase [Bartonella sp. TP]WJW80188.1 homoserine kinase [Bartonella sp. TP]
MAVYTKITKAELNDFLIGYDLGNLLAYQAITAGVENTNYLLYCKTGKYILTLFEKRVSLEDLPFYFNLHKHLLSKNIPCPKIIESKDRKTMGNLCNRKAAIISFIEGYESNVATIVQCELLGNLVARMHLAVADFSERLENKFSLDSWRNLWNISRVKATNLGIRTIEFIEKELVFLTQNWRTDLPSGVIHADIFPDNVLFQGARLGGIIDFYFSCYDMFAYDIAICLTAWCFNKDNSYEAAKARAFLHGYEKVRVLSNLEKQTMPLLMRGSAMRFLQTRLYDFFHTMPDSQVILKDPMVYLRRLQFYGDFSNFNDIVE